MEKVNNGQIADILNHMGEDLLLLSTIVVDGGTKQKWYKHGSDGEPTPSDNTPIWYTIGKSRVPYLAIRAKDADWNIINYWCEAPQIPQD